MVRVGVGCGGACCCVSAGSAVLGVTPSGRRGASEYTLIGGMVGGQVDSAPRVSIKCGPKTSFEKVPSIENLGLLRRAGLADKELRLGPGSCSPD